MEDLSGRQFGAYTIIGPLGEGGMASVYKAHQPAVNRDVALKILGRHFMQDPEFITRFKHEAWVVAQFQHPHILPVFDFGETDGYTYLVMPLIKGGQLSDLMTGEPMRLDMVDRVMRQICDALDYAHSKGVIHRDIKPSNILVDERLNCLVSDFGIARMTEGTTKLTATGAVVGTPTYMSPEQAAGETVGPQSDLYSLGIMLYEMVAGRVPFKAETPFAIALKHLSAPMPPPATFNPRLGPSIEAVVLKAVARSAADRYQSGEEFAKALSAAIRDTQSIQGQPTIVAPATEKLPATDHVAPTIAVPPVSEVAPTMAAAPKTVPMTPPPAKTTPLPPKMATRPPTPRATATPAAAARNEDPPRRKLWPWLAAAVPVLAAAVYFGLGGALSSPPSEPPSTPAAAPAAAPPPQPSAPSVEKPRPAAAKPPAPPQGPSIQEPKPPEPVSLTPPAVSTPPDPAPSTPAAAAQSEEPAADAAEGRRGQQPPIGMMERNCQNGRGQACFNLARAFEFGRGVEQDRQRALRLMRRACDLGEERACTALKNAGRGRRNQ
ncbi:MAG TPA: protein kinase [Vicinamibacterales bacterium]|nr:protein kinase [Vicinamibacterales bacterium]